MKPGDLVRVKAPPLVREVTSSTGTVPVGMVGLILGVDSREKGHGATLLVEGAQMRVNRIFLEVISEG